ncbi:MAG: hypothetical protein RQ760_20990 [Sedimentisphaerales bacterium]|nr:hypothetical protein [Sedimentisphaerales bacterium]
MAVLSDKTIKDKIANNELIPNGKADNATHCSYEFTAELMLRGGSNQAKEITEPGIPVEPAQLVWIRAREEISVPASMVGLWIQTQTLARQGLLLLNITLIEPGYEGPLTAVLVNFGNKKVIIRPDTKIAKVVFLTLDSKADKLVEKRDSKTYDAKLLEMAANAPTSFLQLESFLPNIEERAKARIMAMDKEVELNVGNIVNDAQFKLQHELGEQMKRTFFKGHIGLIAGFLFGCLAVLFLMTTILPRFAAEYSGVEEIAKKASIVQQAKTITDLSTQLHTMETEIESLKKQIQADTANTNHLSDTNNADPNQ